MAVRTKGKEMDLHRHWRGDYRHGQMASHLMTMEATVRSLMTTTILMVPEVTSYSLEGLGLRTATCIVQFIPWEICRCRTQSKPKRAYKP